ncbi:MAG: alpha/beta hydrolase [Sphingomicrobium sp.]
MSIERRTFLGSGLALLTSAATAQSAPPAPASSDPATPFFPPSERFPLWPGQPPGAPKTRILPNWTMNNAPPNRELWIRGVPFPEVHVYRPARPDGSALLSLPGGAYEFLAVQNEGLDAAERFNADRTTVFVLTYRLPVDGWADRSTVALQDAQRAMRLIRSRASLYRIDPARLGVLGFSAGGHLAADLAVSFDQQLYKPVDAADQLSARPAFVGLVYPVISLDPKITQGTSSPNLLGPNPGPALIAARSPTLHVNAATPPSFVAAACDDSLILVDNSLQWIEACRRAKAPVEAHLFSEGGHGFGFHLPRDLPAARWPDLFALWLRKHGG